MSRTAVGVLTWAAALSAGLVVAAGVGLADSSDTDASWWLMPTAAAARAQSPGDNEPGDNEEDQPGVNEDVATDDQATVREDQSENPGEQTKPGVTADGTDTHAEPCGEKLEWNCEPSTNDQPTDPEDESIQKSPDGESKDAEEQIKPGVTADDTKTGDDLCTKLGGNCEPTTEVGSDPPAGDDTQEDVIPAG